MLVLEDDRNIREFLVELLEQRGCEVKAFDALERGREWLASNVPRGLFCDVRLPDGDGLELLRWARARDSLRAMPVVMMSGGDEDERGDAAFLRKPFAVQALDAQLERMLATRGPAGAASSRRDGAPAGPAA